MSISNTMSLCAKRVTHLACLHTAAMALLRGDMCCAGCVGRLLHNHVVIAVRCACAGEWCIEMLP